MLSRTRIIHLLKHYRIKRSFPLTGFNGRFQLSNDSKTDAHTDQIKLKADSVIEIYDQLDYQWEEDPEFDYQSVPRTRVNYDILSPSEYFTKEEIKLLLERENARDIVVLDLPAGSFVETMVICSGLSSTHVRKAAGAVYQAFKYKRRESSLRLPTVEGLRGSCGWIVIDLGNMILHLFLPEMRAHYRLEELWSGDETTPAEDEGSHSPAGSNLSSMKTFDWKQLIEEVQSERSNPSSRDV